ncbi:fungal specific transcription factor domain containing protein [Colletotrichum incanum]|uniref:Fungal specific transcription factor domain containing protein n=1 Tax=Colletotrichum incanum TaxID=1573173 RepID=A0A167CCV2_COLIC|nr:fungal specific transcription factor domain containing protein [Colletotrichum incanum]OHW95619.1 hypothetical protein CSPAE12_05788 [Colletotrichum incanum]
MPPSRPTARCCRAVQQQIRAPLDNIWITDGVLASAFERYCHVSRLARRKSSSVPGPLENRRRLGKRKMTDLHMNTQPTLPPWTIDFPVDLSQWKWQPPTQRSSKENRDLQSQQSQSVPSRILRWWSTKREAQEEEPDRTEIEHQSEIEFYDQLAKARAAVAASTSNAIGPAYYNFIGGLQHDLKMGILDPEAVEMAVSTFPSSLIDTGVDGEVVNASIEMFLSAVVSGIASSKVLGPSEFDASLWNLVLYRISQLPANDATTLLFQTTLEAIPRQYINDAHEGIVAAVQTLAVSHSPGCGRAADIGAALCYLSPANHGALLDGMEAAVYEGSAAFEEETRQKLRLLWLQILAHMPHVDTNYLLDACVRSAYFDRELFSLVGRDLSRLLIQQWASRGYLWSHKAVEAAWEHDSSSHAELSFASLVTHICDLEPGGFRDGRHVALLMSFFRALRRFGREKELMASLQSFCEAREKLPILPFKRLAMASRDYNTALEIFMFLDTHAIKLDGKLESQWNWTAWTHHVKAMIEDESVSSFAIWKVVDCGVARSFKNPAQLQLLMKRRTKLMEDMTVWFSQADHFTDRMALRHVCRCVGWLRGHNIALSHKVLVAVLSVVTREFKRGEFGRTRRLGWLLNLVEQYQGPEERRAVAQVLQRWRRANGDLYVVAKRRADERALG